MRDSSNRIVGEGDKVKAAIRRIVISLNKNTRSAYNNWKDFVKNVNNKTLFENSRAQKLTKVLEKVPRRSLKFTTDKLVAQDHLVLTALRRLAISSEKRPKHAIETWKSFITSCKTKNILDNLRSLKLKENINQLAKKLLKTVFQRVVSGHEKAAEKLKTLSKVHNKKPLRACNGWKTKVEVDKVMKPLTAHRLRSALSKLPLKNLKRTFELLLNQNSGQSGLRKIFIFYNNIAKRAFVNWKEFMFNCRKGVIMNQMRAQKLKFCLSRIPARTVKGGFMNILGNGSKTLGMLRLLGYKALQRPKQAVILWKNYVESCKRGELFDRVRSQRLLTVIKSISVRTMREASKQIITAQDKIKHMFKLFAVEIKDNTKSAWSKWRAYVSEVKRGALLDAIKSQKLRKCIESVSRRIIKDALERVIGDGNKVKGALRRLEISCYKIRDSAFLIWKTSMINKRTRESLEKLRAQQLRSTLNKLPQRHVKDAVDRILGDGGKVAGCLRRLVIFVKNQQRESFDKWKQKAFIKKAEILTKGNKIHRALEALSRRSLKTAFSNILGDKTALRAVCRLTRNLMNKQISALEGLRDRVAKLHMIKKVNSAYLLMKMLKVKCNMMLKGRFTIWKNLDLIRIARLKRKAIMHWIFNSSINYQNAFWKWKYILTIRGLDLNPKHSLMQKRLSMIGYNYQGRLKQFALFKLLLFFRSNLLSAQSRKSFNLSFNSLVKGSREEVPRPSSPERKTDSKVLLSVRESVSTDAAGKLSKEELIGVNQLGAAEVIILQLKNVRLRHIAVGFACVSLFSKQIGVFDDERGRLIEQINELRYDKHSLLEDNTALRHHNEALIENLEKTNMNFQSLSLHLDQMRLGRMVRVISKMIELPMLEALIMVKHQTGIN